MFVAIVDARTPDDLRREKQQKERADFILHRNSSFTLGWQMLCEDSTEAA